MNQATTENSTVESAAHRVIKPTLHHHGVNSLDPAALIEARTQGMGLDEHRTHDEREFTREKFNGPEVLI